VILTTHYLEEAESMCRNLAIIDRGEIVENGPMKTLLAKLDVEGFLLDIDGELPAELPHIEGIALHAEDRPHPGSGRAAGDASEPDLFADSTRPASACARCAPRPIGWRNCSCA
jgi:ABC-type multidrug transport system ATPase subunit